MKRSIGLRLALPWLCLIVGCQSPSSPSGASTYRVTYDANKASGGSVPIDASNYTQGASVTVKGNTGNLTRTAYAFEGWNTRGDASGASFAPGSSFTMG